MGYLKILNLYADNTILMFKEAWASEKCHGTSQNISWDGNKISFFSGGEKHERMVSLFDIPALEAKFKECFAETPVKIFGEGYGGSCQGMSGTYGKDLKFIAFDVFIGGEDGVWLDMPKAEDVVKKLNLEFIPYVKISTDLKEIDAQRDADSEIAIRRGMGPGKIREGIVLRSLIELRTNNGSRVICKHKRDEFRETKSPRPIIDPAKLQVITNAEKAADEFVTEMRLSHILDKLPEHSIEKMGDILKAMQEDILREGAGEVVESDALRKAISRKTALMYKNRLKSSLTIH